MAFRPIVVVPHKALAIRAKEIQEITDAIRTLAHDMADTMYRAPGVGLAANQVGVPVRLIVVDVDYAYQEPKDKRKNPIFIINPRICASDGTCTREEGCLSLPELSVEIARGESVRVEGIDLKGNPLVIEAGDMLARALQHEIDHLEGVTILDYASSLKKSLYKRKLKKLGGRSA